MKKTTAIYIFSLAMLSSYTIGFARTALKTKAFVEVAVVNPQIEVLAYPNPFKEFVNLEITANNCTPTVLKVYDIIGVEQVNISLDEHQLHGGSIKLQIKDLSEGIYFCNIYSHDKLLESKKIICTR